MLEKIKKNYSVIFLSAFFLISFVFFNVLISTVFFIFKISIQKVFVLLALVGSIMITTIFLSKKHLLQDKKERLKNICISIIFPILIIVLSIFINGKIFDYTWDGNSYQKATTGMLAIGWNPLYQELEDFDDNSEEKINIGDESPIYINNYAKASNIFAANVYKLIGNIETGKSINTIVIVALFLFTFSFLLYKDKSIVFSIFFSICVITYPVICSQFLTNYIDILVYAFLYLTIFSFFILEENEFVFSKKDNLLLFFMILTLAINIKFSLFGFVGMYCLGYYIWYIYRVLKGDLDKNFFLNFTITSILSVVIGVFVIGLSVYPKNFMDHGNPFFPLMGNDNVDIMFANQPKEFTGKAPLQKFLISLFSKAEDIFENSKDVINLKIPFTITKDEIANAGLPDLRLSGNGVFFSGIFLISLIIIVIFSKDLYNKNNKKLMLFFIPIFITVGMIFFLQEAWWARYFPQLYIFPLVALFLLNENSNIKLVRIMQYVFIFVLLTNNFITFQDAVKRTYNNNVKCNIEFQLFESVPKTPDSIMVIYTTSFNGAKFNIIDRTREENIIFINQYSEDKTDINTFLNGKLEWRYEVEEVR